MEDKQKGKGIVTFIGAIILNAAMNSVFTLNIISVYIMSYLHHFNPHYDLAYCYLFFPFLILGIGIANYIYLLTSSFLHSHMILGIGSVLVLISLVLQICVTDVYAYYLAMLLSGLGIGLTRLTSFMKAYYSRKKENEAYANEIISSIANILIAILVVSFIFMMNPNYKLNSDRGFFTYSISQKVFYTYITLICLICLGGVIGCVMIDKEKLVEVKKRERGSLTRVNNEEEEEVIPLSKQIATFCSFYPIVKEQIIPSDKSKKRMTLEYSQAIHSMRLYRIALINFTSSFLENLIFIIFIPYASMNEINSLALYYSSLCMFILSAAIHPLFKCFEDHLSLRKAMLPKSVVSLIIGCVFAVSKGSTGAYLFLCFLAVVTNAVRERAVVRHLQSCLKDVFVYRYIINSSGLSFILSGVLARFIPSLFTNRDTGYFIIFLLGGLLNVIAFLLTFWEGKIAPQSSTVVSSDNVFL